MRRDRARGRARAADRADRQPRAAPASPRRSCSGCASTSPTSTRGSRRIVLPKDYVRLRLCGEHATDVSDASGTLLFDVARPALERRGARRARARPRVAARARSRARPSRASPPTAIPVAAGAGDQAAGALGVGVDRPGPAVGRARHLGRRVRGARRGTPPTRRRASTPSATPCPGAWHAMGVMLSAAGSLRVAARRRRARASATTSSTPRPRAWPAGAEGLAVPPLPRGRAHAARRSRRPRRVRRASSSATTAARSSRAVLEGVAFGLRDSLELVARARRPTRAGARLRRRRPQRAVAADRRLGARAAARARRRRRGRGVRRRAPRRRRRGRVARRPCRRRRNGPPRGALRARAEWVEVYRERRERFRALYPAVR